MCVCISIVYYSGEYVWLNATHDKYALQALLVTGEKHRYELCLGVHDELSSIFSFFIY